MSSLIVCHACDLVHRRDSAATRGRLRCARCRAELTHTPSVGPEVPLALALSALVLFILANVYPLASLEVNGTTRLATLAGAALALLQHGYPTVATLVAFTTILVPFAEIAGVIGVLAVILRARRAPTGQPVSLLKVRWLAPLRPWSMVEVFLLGALVALTRLSSMARVVPGPALDAYGLLMLARAALWASLPRAQLWRWLEAPA